MLSAYPACFFQEEDSYAVVFPDLNYLTTGEETLPAAQAVAAQCLAGYLYTCQQDGQPIASPSPLDGIRPAEVAQVVAAKPEKAWVELITVDVEAWAEGLRSVGGQA